MPPGAASSRSPAVCCALFSSAATAPSEICSCSTTSGPWPRAGALMWPLGSWRCCPHLLELGASRTGRCRQAMGTSPYGALSRRSRSASFRSTQSACGSQRRTDARRASRQRVPLRGGSGLPVLTPSAPCRRGRGGARRARAACGDRRRTERDEAKMRAQGRSWAVEPWLLKAMEFVSERFKNPPGASRASPM